MHTCNVDCIEPELERLAWEYGKLGLIVDDSPECAARLARSLYGADALPPWWRIARSLACAAASLSAWRKIFADEEFGPLRGLLVIDRYLPLTCTGGRTVPWDDYDWTDEEKPSVRRMQQGVLGLVQRDERYTLPAWHAKGPAYETLFITSYPPGPDESREPKMAIRSWQTRSVEILHEERRQILHAPEWRTLLRFGPDQRARIGRKGQTPPKSLFDEESASQAHWRARTWHKNLVSLADLLRRRKPVILMTGAGASLSPGPAAPGMPTTEVILESLCAPFMPPFQKQQIELHELSKLRPPCVGEKRSQSEVPTLTWEPKSGQTPIDWLIDQAATPGGVRKLDWKLEALFSRRLGEGGKLLAFEEFHHGFREALYRSDHGFCYHHWLLAQMPWASVVTTNFDGFHERAAAAVARIPWLEKDNRQNALRLGTPGDVSSRRWKPKEDDGCLFKPYGSLYSPKGVIALSFREIEDFRRYFENALSRALSEAYRWAGQKRGWKRRNGRNETEEKQKQGALVVIGHSMRNNSIGEVLIKSEDDLQDLELLWVDPMAYRRCSPRSGSENSTWERLIERRMEKRLKDADEEESTTWDQPGSCSGPIPAGALEFIYDLWWVYTKAPR